LILQLIIKGLRREEKPSTVTKTKAPTFAKKSINHPHRTSKQYKDLYTHLESYLKILSPKQILISGSYSESKQKDNLCRYIGKKLLENNIVIVSGGGRPGLQVSQGAFETMERENRYRAENIVFYRRMKQRIISDFPHFGTIK
jgi:hypothetical protein